MTDAIAIVHDVDIAAGPWNRDIEVLAAEYGLRSTRTADFGPGGGSPTYDFSGPAPALAEFMASIGYGADEYEIDFPLRGEAPDEALPTVKEWLDAGSPMREVP
jgi:hypothetical protein